jgi:hypothetical protein
MNDKQSFRLLSLDGGLVTDVSPILLAPDKGFAEEAINLEFSLHGVLRKRPGTAQVFAPVATTPIGAHQFVKASTQEVHNVVAHGTVVQRWDSATEAWVDLQTGLSGAGVDFLTFADSLLMVDGNNPSARWDGITVTTPTQFPKAKYLAEYRLRVAAAGDPANPSKLYISHTGDPELWSTTDSRSNAAELFVSPDDGDVITGLCNVGEGGLLVGKQRALYGLFGYSRANFMVDLLDPTVGVGSHKTMLYIRPYAYFVNQYGVYRMEVGSPAERISSSIQSVFDDRINRSRIAESRAVLVGRNYVVTLPTGETDTFTLAFHVDRLAWCEWTQPHIQESFLVTDDPTSNVYYFPRKELHPRKISQELHFDLLDPIPSSVTFVESSAGLPEVEKDLNQLYLMCKAADKPYHINVWAWADDPAWNLWQQVASNLEISGQKGAQVTHYVPLEASNVRYFKIKLESVGRGEKFHPMALTFVYIPKELW